MHGDTGQLMQLRRCDPDGALDAVKTHAEALNWCGGGGEGLGEVDEETQACGCANVAALQSIGWFGGGGEYDEVVDINQVAGSIEGRVGGVGEAVRGGRGVKLSRRNSCADWASTTE